jgi:hypothetical protein
MQPHPLPKPSAVRAATQTLPPASQRHPCLCPPQVLLNDRLAAAAAGAPLRTAGGAALPGGALVLWATGTRPSTGFMGPELAETLDSGGLIKVAGRGGETLRWGGGRI